ncbi:MAG: glycosyltransferase [Planctomycetota bacterium]|jgi:glycosyltransferase involved in cell wall biosynthesis
MSAIDISVVIPVSERCDSLDGIVRMIDQALAGESGQLEILLVVDGSHPDRNRHALAIAASDARVRILSLARTFGEGAALRAGLQESSGRLILTHPAYLQVEGSVIPRLISKVREEDRDVAFASRLPEKDSWINRVQRWGFNAIVRKTLWVKFKDVACGVRVLRREALEDLSVHGSFHRFVPVLAAMKGLRVAEVPVKQHPEAKGVRVYSPGVYVRRILDLVNIFFVLRFTYKPLRFFGLVGGVLFLAGFAILLYLAFIKLVFSAGIGDRPLLLLGAMLSALGFQVFALGLLGELITFTYAARSKPYTIREINVRAPRGSANREEPASAGAAGTERGD